MGPVFEISPLAAGGGLKLVGELDLATAPQLVSALGDLRSRQEYRLDFAELTFIDSSGLHAILAFARSLNGSGPLVILDPSEAIARVLDVAEIGKHPDVEIRHTGGTELAPR